MDASGAKSEAKRLLPVANATVPYWRTQLHAIDEHRTTPDLPQECDIAIIGAGLSGVSTAYHLAKLAGSEKPSIVMLDARQVCSGATGRNGGHAKVQTNTTLGWIERYGLDVAEEYTAFIREHVYALKEVVETEALDCEFELRRSFDVMLNETEAESHSHGLAACAKSRQQWTTNVGRVPAKHIEQVTSIKGALSAASVPIASFWPYKFVSQLLAKLVADGSVNLQTNTPVTSVEQDSAGNSILQTPRGTFRARKLVFATNAYTAGICPQYAQRIVPYIGTACHIIPRNGPVSPHLSNTYNINFAEGGRIDYLNPRPDGGIVVGGGNWTYKHDKKKWLDNWNDSVLLSEVRPHFDGLMQRHFKGWEHSGAEVDHLWTGVQGLTPDGVPHVGEIPGSSGRQYISAGFNGGGNGQCFLCALGVAKMLLEGMSFEETGLPKLFETSKERLEAAKA